MSKPRIGITANIEIMEAGAHPGMYRAFINYDYVEAVEDAGGVPVLLPVVSDLENVKPKRIIIDSITRETQLIISMKLIVCSL